MELVIVLLSLLRLASLPSLTWSFLNVKATVYRRGRDLACYGMKGWGKVDDRYCWTENDYELEVAIRVPAWVRKQDVLFKASSTALKLGLAGANKALLGGPFKGRIAPDGTFWNLEGEGEGKVIKLLIEKKAGALENSIDWRCVLKAEPATQADYDQPERFNTKAYIQSVLGSQGINMNFVDKEMFGSGSVMGNVSKDTLQDYVNARVLDDASDLFTKDDASNSGAEGK